MPIFRYRATNAQGAAEGGDMVGADLNEVSQRLREKGLSVTEIALAETTSDPLTNSSAFAQRSKVQTHWNSR